MQLILPTWLKQLTLFGLSHAGTSYPLAPHTDIAHYDNTSGPFMQPFPYSWAGPEDQAHGCLLSLVLSYTYFNTKILRALKCNLFRPLGSNISHFSDYLMQVRLTLWHHTLPSPTATIRWAPLCNALRTLDPWVNKHVGLLWQQRGLWIGCP